MVAEAAVELMRHGRRAVVYYCTTYVYFCFGRPRVYWYHYYKSCKLLCIEDLQILVIDS